MIFNSKLLNKTTITCNSTGSIYFAFFSSFQKFKQSLRESYIFSSAVIPLAIYVYIED